jgi:hypothetical protein
MKSDVWWVERRKRRRRKKRSRVHAYTKHQVTIVTIHKTDRQTGRQIDRQTDRQTDRHTHTQKDRKTSDITPIRTAAAPAETPYSDGDRNMRTYKYVYPSQSTASLTFDTEPVFRSCEDICGGEFKTSNECTRDEKICMTRDGLQNQWFSCCHWNPTRASRDIDGCERKKMRKKKQTQHNFCIQIICQLGHVLRFDRQLLVEQRQVVIQLGAGGDDDAFTKLIVLRTTRPAQHLQDVLWA